MSSHFFPMLSSTPPPIDDTDSAENDDDDDEFGIFVKAKDDYDYAFDSKNFNSKTVSSNLDSCQTKSAKLCNSVNTLTNSEISKEHFSENCRLQNSADNSGSDICDESDSPAKTNEDVKLTDDIRRPKYHESKVMNNIDAMSFNSIPSDESDTECRKFFMHSANSIMPLELSSSQEFVPSEDERQSDSQHCDPTVSERECHNNEISDSSGILARTETQNPSSSTKTKPELPQSDIHNNSIETVQFSGVNNLDDSSKVISAIDTEYKQCYVSENSSLVITNSDISCSSSTQPLSNYHEDFYLCNSALSADVFDRNKLPNKQSTVSSNPESFAPFSTIDDGDDDFDDFQKHLEDESFGDFRSTEPASSCDHMDNAKSQEECFADFESCTVDINQPWTQSNTETGEFADFETAAFRTEESHQSSGASISESKVACGSSSKISKVIDTVFPLPKETGAVHNYDYSLGTLQQNSKSWRLWEKIHDTDQTPGLPFQWGVSHSFQQLLRSVNVDYHSILRTSTVPFFASGLGLLEPTKGPQPSSGKDKNQMSENDENYSMKDPIPPVHFDWGSSGLVNPLDNGQTASTLMDLSFLSSSKSSTSTKKSSADFSLENELLKPISVNEMKESAPKAPILEQLLSLNANSSVTTLPDLGQNSRPPNLSQETIRVLDHLPNINFMRAKVLMFPVPDNT